MGLLENTQRTDESAMLDGCNVWQTYIGLYFLLLVRLVATSIFH